MSLANRVLLRFPPTITSSRIEFKDFESSKADNKLFDGNQVGYVQRNGLMEPIVMIGGIKLAKDKIKALNIRQNSMVPSISIMFVDDGFIFTTGGYPISEIIASVYIQSPIKNLKSMSADFLINSISSFPIPNSKSIVYTISGELNIPKINGYYSMALKNMTSVQALKAIARDLGLGFADNQDEGTNDAMTWILPNYSYKDFIAHITKYSYKDDSNFFDCFIDRYYVLNFVNVEKQFSRDAELDTGYLALDQTLIDKRRSNPEEDDNDSIEVPIILTNSPEAEETEFFITDFSMGGDHGDILKTHGIRTYAFWYDHGNPNPSSTTQQKVENKIKEIYGDSFLMHYAEPLTSLTENDGKAPQTVKIDEYVPTDESDSGVEISTGNWVGINYGNAHNSYKYAELINHHNRIELEKNMLEVSLRGFNVNVTRGSRVKVDIYLDKQAAIQTNSMRSIKSDDPLYQNLLETGVPGYDEKPATMILDKALSDFYYVYSMSYSYENGSYYTTVVLSRRHWLSPK